MLRGHGRRGSKLHASTHIDLGRALSQQWSEVRTAWLVALAVPGLAGCGRLGFEPRTANSDGGPDPDTIGPTDPDGGLSIPPIAAWSFDANTGQVAPDGSGNGRTGTLGTTPGVDAADPQWITTPNRICTGAGLTFDGTDDIITIPGASPPNLSTFSISFSLFATGSGGGQLGRILTKEAAGSPDVVVHFRAIDNAIAINMFNTSGMIYATFASGVVIGERAQWVIRYDDAGDRKVHVFKNGIETSYLRQDPVVGPLMATTNPWMIGNEASRSRAIAGTLDALRVYDVALGSSEIAALAALCP